VGTYGQSIQVWDANRLELLVTLKHRGAFLTTAAFGPGGILATGDQGGAVRLWETEQHPHYLTMKGHGAPIASLALSPDEKLLASGSYDADIRLWNLKTGQTTGVLSGHDRPVHWVEFSPDGTLLASASCEEPSIRVWGVQSRRLVRTLRAGERSSFPAIFGPDGRRLASRGESAITIWDTGSWQPVRTISASGPGVLNFSADGRTINCGEGVWDTSSGQKLQSLKDCRWSRFHPRTNELLWRSSDGKVRARNIQTEKDRLLPLESGGRLKLNADGTKIFVLTKAGDIQVRAYDSGKEIVRIRPGRSAGWTMALSRDGKRLFVGDSRGEITVWDLDVAVNLAADSHSE
jgi:WD40 repeat protein